MVKKKKLDFFHGTVDIFTELALYHYSVILHMYCIVQPLRDIIIDHNYSYSFNLNHKLNFT